MLPLRLHHGQVLRVVSYGVLDIRVALWRRIDHTAEVFVEGLDVNTVPPALRNEAMRALINVVGGASVLLLVAHDDAVRPRVRLYLNDIVSSPCDGLVVPVPGLHTAHLEVGLCLEHLRQHAYRRDAVQHALGRGRA